MAADPEQKFDAAVQVIRWLPKSGSFQPSHDTMLKFYGYYKQAKEGPCKEAKPSFWDVVKKAKWEAWSKLGNTSKEDAMENYVNQLKEVIANMPETVQTSQCLRTLEPFYKAAYKNSENVPPIFNIFRSKQNRGKTSKMNGHVPTDDDKENKRHLTPEVKHMQNGLDEETLNSSTASMLHNIKTSYSPQKPLLNGDVSLACMVHVNGEEKRDAEVDKIAVEEAGPVLNSPSKSIRDDNDNENQDCNAGGNVDEDEDDDDLFCDSLGPEVLEQEVGRSEVLHSGKLLEAVQEDVVGIGSYDRRNRSSFSDVEIIEQFETNNGESGIQVDTSTPHFEKITHVHFEDLNTTSPSKMKASETGNADALPVSQLGDKESVVQPNQLGTGGGGGDERGLPRSSSVRQQGQRNVSQPGDRPLRYGHSHRYRRRSQESDSDESPGRSDPNSSSERDDAAVDRIADLLLEIQDNMKKILERLKRVENSLQNSQNSWFENYRPSKTVIFLILWPFVVNIILKFLQKKYNKWRSR